MPLTATAPAGRPTTCTRCRARIPAPPPPGRLERAAHKRALELADELRAEAHTEPKPWSTVAIGQVGHLVDGRWVSEPIWRETGELPWFAELPAAPELGGGPKCQACIEHVIGLFHERYAALDDWLAVAPLDESGQPISPWEAASWGQVTRSMAPAFQRLREVTKMIKKEAAR